MLSRQKARKRRSLIHRFCGCVREAEVGVCEGGREAAAASVGVVVDAATGGVDEVGVSGLLVISGSFLG
jgi:hypothetical protein